MKFILAITLLLSFALLSCRRNSTAIHQVGTEKIQIAERGETVRIFSLTGTGAEVELSDTGAAHRLGWKVRRISQSRIRLSTGDVGSFDIFSDGAGCTVVPAGVYLSANKSKAIKLVEEGANVHAQLGEISPPFTDIWVSDELTIASAKTDDLTVMWSSETDVEIKDSAGKTVGKLKAK